MAEKLLEIDDLDVRYRMDGPDVRPVDGVSLDVDHGETFGLVGESGCGKTTLAKAIIELLDDNGEVESGEIWFDGAPPDWCDDDGEPRQEIVDDPQYPVRDDGMTNLAALSKETIRDVRWRDIAIIPQSALNALNPVYKVGDQIVEAILRHEPETAEDEAYDRAEELLERVGIEAERAYDYAHEFSGGMKQRAVIAMSMACNPDLLIADEPTTALDVIIQDRVLDEISSLQAEFGVAMLVVSHDISVMAETCDRMGVMYGGKMMESGSATDIFEETANPYTLGLRNSFPTIEESQERLVSIPGTPPTLRDPEAGCRFADRCPFAVEECRDAHPPMYDVDRAIGEEPGETPHESACYRLDSLAQLQEDAAKEETWLQQTTH